MNYKILVNKENPYNKNDFSNINLKSITNSLNEEYLLEKNTLKAYLNLKKELIKENINIDIISGYRSILEQEKLVDEYNLLYGEEYVKKYVALPGCSEHHTGLCFDIGLIVDNKLIFEGKDLKKYEDIFLKINSKLETYGLILRYPKDKEIVTGYNYEPWHFRYVGKSTAKIIRDNNLTLEEYTELYNKSGVLLINKPIGITSRDAVNKVSQIFDTKKVGHNGTLDPLAEGLLVITINKATKINELLTSEDKEYIAKVKVGIETDTLDLEGKIIKESNKKVTKDEIVTMFDKFPKKYLQEVPKYSAVKINGKKLYEYARNNQEIDLPKREVIIKELELLDYNETSFSFRIIVSKGTYIRSIIKDMGNFLNIPCTMSSLKRTKCGNFELDNAYDLDKININSKIIKIDEALNIPKIEVSLKDIKKLLNGADITNTYNIIDMVLFTTNNTLIAIYKNINNILKCFKMLK